MPTSEKQTAANRRNAKKSTGPGLTRAYRLLYQLQLAHTSKTLPMLTSKLENTQNEPICTGGTPGKSESTQNEPISTSPLDYLAVSQLRVPQVPAFAEGERVNLRFSRLLLHNGLASIAGSQSRLRRDQDPANQYYDSLYARGDRVPTAS